MVVLGDLATCLYKCQASNLYFGLSNGDITNIFVGMYENQTSSEMLNFCKAINQESLKCVEKIIGFRIEKSENYKNLSCIRCIIDQ